MKTTTAPWDYMNKEHTYELSCDKVAEQIEIGRRQQINRNRTLLEKLVALDPEGWEAWYDKTIPEVVSLSELGRLVAERIDELTFDIKNADQIGEDEDARDQEQTTNDILSSFHPA
jgi:hypothetical protein